MDEKPGISWGLASKPSLETATVSTCRYTREGAKAARVFRSTSLFVEDEGGKRYERTGETVKQRVPARGIIALLQIIGQTPTRGERVFRARVCVHAHVWK